MRYKNEELNSQAFLALMFFFFFLSYITEFAIDAYEIHFELTGRSLYGELGEDLRQAVTWASVALVPVFGVLFALEILVFATFMALYYLFPHTSAVYEEYGMRVAEVNPSLERSIACYLISFLSLVPGVIFLL